MDKPVQGSKQRVKNKDDIGQVNMSDMYGSRLRLPAEIAAELDKKGLAHRFVSIKKIQESGGYHPNGWTPYTLDNPKKNVITGNVDNTFRVGDLILAVKPKNEHAQHLAWLKQKADAQTKAHQNSVREMRAKIREGKADKHISLIEGYEENESDD